jgi:hypothetical protein
MDAKSPKQANGSTVPEGRVRYHPPRLLADSRRVLPEREHHRIYSSTIAEDAAAWDG